MNFITAIRIEFIGPLFFEFVRNSDGLADARMEMILTIGLVFRIKPS